MDIQAKVAGRLLEAAGRRGPNYTILRENVTHLLTQFKPDFVESLDSLPRESLLEGLNGAFANGPHHLVPKLWRDIRHRPYTDQEVLDRLEVLDAQLKQEAAAIVQASHPYPCKFYLAGSLERGRFGARSDLDVLCQASPEIMKANRWKGSHDDVSFQYMDTDQPQLMVEAFAPTREVTLAEIQRPGFLLSHYCEGIERKGLSLEDGHLVADGPTHRPVETPPEAAKHIMWTLPMV
ncbi:MAG: hypothetical protein AB7S38_24335 [Vulcanimicrobiota bacterium]